MAANPWLLGHWLLKMVANLLILGHLAPHAPWSSPELIRCVQNGFHLLWIACFTIDCSKWLPIHDCLAIGSSKWLPFYWYMAFWILMLLVPVQTWSALLKMASIYFELVIWLLIVQNGCQSVISWPLVTQNGCQSTFACSLSSTCSLVQSRPDLLGSKWLPFTFLSWQT